MIKKIVSPRQYTEEFKNEAVKLVLQQGYSQADAAESLGISRKNISRWIKAYQGGELQPCLKVKFTEEQREIQRLRQENQRLRMEKEILKKAAAFFASDPK